MHNGRSVPRHTESAEDDMMVAKFEIIAIGVLGGVCDGL